MNDKQRVAEQAANLIEDKMLVGLGTGSTADYFIETLAERVAGENLDVTVVSSSVVSFIKARDLGLPLITLEQITEIDLYVDGADEVSPELTLLKGQGADLVNEKLLAKASREFWVLVDQSKRVERIGQQLPIPIEVMPFAWQLVKKQLENIGGQGDLRRLEGKNGLAMSSYGSLLLDMSFSDELPIEKLDQLLNATPGVVEHGIFHQLADRVFMGREGVVEQLRR